MNKQISVYDIFLSFLKTGIILIGGGYVILPILQAELVENKKWLTSSELMDYYALSQSLPGLIAINISIFAGYKIRGFIGAIAAVLGLTFSAFWIITALCAVLDKIAGNTLVQGAFKGIEIGVIILIISALREMAPAALNNRGSIIIFTVTLTVMIIFKIPPSWVIMGTILISVIFKLFSKRAV